MRKTPWSGLGRLRDLLTRPDLPPPHHNPLPSAGPGQAAAGREGFLLHGPHPTPSYKFLNFVSNITAPRTSTLPRAWPSGSWPRSRLWRLR